MRCGWYRHVITDASAAFTQETGVCVPPSGRHIPGPAVVRTRASLSPPPVRLGLPSLRSWYGCPGCICLAGPSPHPAGATLAENSLPSGRNCPLGAAGILVRKHEKSLFVRELVLGKFVSLVLLIAGLFICQGSGDDSSLNMKFSLLLPTSFDIAS